ncbi:MAG TPA: flagellar M-ring protein FliF [Opitutae bacterium]|nr:flagellar M-ring protein FliF [Opitutae bacterium]|tara:strand:+ start:1134 stop:2690 length:1557 start_codon:yes stop_codon:yes gene_type:complete
MKKLLEQIQLLWSQLGMNQRITLVMSSFGIMAVMLGMLYWSGRPNYRLLYGRMDTQDMAEVVEYLDQNEIAYKLNDSGTSVYVSSDSVAKVRMEMATRGIPQGGSVGYEIFDRGNFGISDFIQRTNYIRAIQGELSRTIAQLNGVKAARVMVVMPENKLLVNTVKGRATASVFVDTGAMRLDRESVNSVRFLVANSVEGLLLEDVAVVDQRGNVLSEELQETGIAGSSGQLKYRQELESYFSEKVETMLGRVVGMNNVVARVSVDVDTDALTKIDRLFDPESQVVRSQTQTEDTTISSETRQGQALAGVAGNIPATQAGGQDVPTNSTQETHKNKNISYEINETTVEVVKTPGSIRHISAAVFVAMKAEGGGAAAKTVARSEEAMSQLQVMVVNALGGATSGNVEVTLQEMPFTDTTIQSGGGVSWVDYAYPWMDLIKPLAGLMVAAVIFFVFMRMIKRHKAQGDMIKLFHGEEGAVGAGGVDLENAPLTADTLNQLIQQRPENIGLALKQWASTEKN